MDINEARRNQPLSPLPFSMCLSFIELIDEYQIATKHFRWSQAGILDDSRVNQVYRSTGNYRVAYMFYCPGTLTGGQHRKECPQDGHAKGTRKPFVYYVGCQDRYPSCPGLVD